MQYNDLILFCFGIGGVLIHNLTKIYELKKSSAFVTVKYFGMEWPAIAISLFIVALAVLGKNEVLHLKNVSNLAGFAFTAIGYMGQSLFVKFMGRASKAVGVDTPAETFTDKFSQN